LVGIERHLFRELSAQLNSVSKLVSQNDLFQVLHVRRGDYLSIAQTHGLLSPRYYEKNLDEKMYRILVTDDLSGAQDVISVVNPDQVFHPGNSSAWQTLALMAEAKRLILANSTLSWWGAFLANQNNAEVLFPEPFYKGLPPQLHEKLVLPDVKMVEADFY